MCYVGGNPSMYFIIRASVLSWLNGRSTPSTWKHRHRAGVEGQVLSDAGATSSVCKEHMFFAPH